ncbi:hypothetical protein [Paenibacillus sp. WLX2291]|uniref:hypothetical protein n=1 Tax=Paenibacillus sp. WLX2291 TaxID=3296934 RepID=UPI003983E3AF
MKTGSYAKLTFADIKHKLPAERQIVWWNNRQPEAVDEQTILYYDGHLELDVLNLDDPHTAGWLSDDPIDEHLAGAAHHPPVLFVDGDLTVQRLIANEHTQRAGGLIVLGNLYTPYMLIGGQEVYVTGNMMAEQWFWGDGQGSLTVDGELSTGLLLHTDNYTMNVRGNVQCSACWRDLEPVTPWDGVNRLSAFDVTCVQDQDGDQPHLDRARIMTLLLQGESVLQLERVRLPVIPVIPLLFENTDVNPVNMRRVTDASLLGMRHPEDTAPCYEFWTDELFVRGVAYGDEGMEGCFQSIYIQNRGRQAVLLRSEPVEQQRNILPGLLSGNSAYLWQVSRKFRYLDGADTDWHTLNQGAPSVFHRLADEGWMTLLQSVSNYEFARNLIQPEQIRELLALPLAEPYDDFYDEQRHGLWLGPLFIAFRQPGALFNGEPQTPLLRIGRQYEDEYGMKHHENYFYTICNQADGSQSVQIGYKADEDHGRRLPLNYTGEAALHYAVPLFQRAMRALRRYNDRLLAGELPEYAAEFAVEYWQEHGVLGSISSGTR